MNPGPYSLTYLVYISSLVHLLINTSSVVVHCRKQRQANRWQVEVCFLGIVFANYLVSYEITKSTGKSKDLSTIGLQLNHSFSRMLMKALHELSPHLTFRDIIRRKGEQWTKKIASHTVRKPDAIRIWEPCKCENNVMWLTMNIMRVIFAGRSENGWQFSRILIL